MRLNIDVEIERRVAGSDDFDMVGTRRQIEMLKMPVEVVHDPGVVPVDIHGGLPRLDLQSKTAGRTKRVEREGRSAVAVRVARKAEGRIVKRDVEGELAARVDVGER